MTGSNYKELQILKALHSLIQAIAKGDVGNLMDS